MLPIGKAKVQRAGRDVTLVAFSKMVGFCLQAAEQLAKEGIDCEVSVGVGVLCVGGAGLLWARARACARVRVFVCVFVCARHL